MSTTATDLPLYPIPGFPHYMINERGDVWSVRWKRYLKPARAGQGGYLKVSLGKGNQRYLHRLVALTFLGEPPPGTEVAHLDGNPKNPARSNLAYVNHLENISHMVAHGTRLAGEDHPLAKLKWPQVDQIRAWSTYGFQGKEIARWFGVSEAQVHRILHNVCWKIERKRRGTEDAGTLPVSREDG